MSETKKFLIRVPLEEKIGIAQTGRMKVGSQIIRHLSKGIYSNAEMAIKELISNAFDADAPEVTIDTKSSPGSIIISDTGLGMDYNDFDQKYVYISKSEKKDKEFTEIFHRPIIGRLGIGFIAVSELCDTMIISSAKKGSHTRFVATLDFSKFRDKNFSEADFNEVSEFTLTNYEKKDPDESFTNIELKSLTPEFRDTLLNIPEQREQKISRMNVTTFSQAVKKIWDTPDHFFIEKRYGPYWKFVMDLASIIPVPYLTNGPIRKLENPEIIKPLKDDVNSLNFKVIFDGMELKKPYLLPTLNKLKDGNFTVMEFSDSIKASNGEKISYRGYMYSQDGGILVDDWRGLIVRIKNTSIGVVHDDFLKYPYEGDSLYYKWTFGEIFIDEGLEGAMNIDRANFKQSDPAYYAFTKTMHEKLKKEVFNSVQTRWRAKNVQQREELETIKKRWRKKSLSKTFNKDFEIEEKKLNPKRDPVELDIKERIITINDLNEILTTFPSRERQFLKEILLAIIIAQEKYPNNIIKQRKILYDLLLDLAKKYPKPGLKYDRSTTGKK